MGNPWYKERQNAIHMTIRDVDCENFDVDTYIDGLHEMGVTCFSFFCGGYVTTYPSTLEYNRVSPYLNGDDLTGRLVKKAKEYGIKTLAMLDLGQLPREVGDAHPDWRAMNADQTPMVADDRLYATCPSSAFRREGCVEMVREIVERYPVDAIKFGGASYGFGGHICHCQRCRDLYKAYSGGKDLPLRRDWNDPNWRMCFAWQKEKTLETVAYLHRTVKELKPNMPVVGNATCFGDPKWTMHSPLDMEQIAKIQDLLQVEVQERQREKDGHVHWQSLTFASETANFIAHMTDKVSFVIPSYFLAWPWRRVAMPYAEQKAYIAQIVAHGGSPMINLSGGPMKVHEDQRGFRAVREMYTFVRDNKEYIHGDHSVARLGLVYSQDSLEKYGMDDALEKIVEPLRGYEAALDEAHIPYDIVSIRDYCQQWTEQYDALILCNVAVMGEKDVENLRDFVKAGGSLIATYETSLYDENGRKRDNFALSDVLGCDYTADARCDAIDPPAYAMAYQEITESTRNSFGKALLSGTQGTSLLPAWGRYAKVTLREDSRKVLTFGPAMQVFPEGFAYPLKKGSNDASLVLRETGFGGKVIYFPGEADKGFLKARCLDMKTLLVNAALYAHRRPVPLETNAPKTVMTVLKEKEGRRMAHVINMTAGERFFDECIPVHDVFIKVLWPKEKPVRAMRLSDKLALQVVRQGEYACVTLPPLGIYDVIVFE